jgi:hypothetical protein
MPRLTPTPLKGVVVGQLACLACLTFAEPQVWQARQSPNVARVEANIFCLEQKSWTDEYSSHVRLGDDLKLTTNHRQRKGTDMGFDIQGKAGNYFGCNNSGWYPLADLCLRIAPEICASCKYWYSNDDDGLESHGALALADALQAVVDCGSLEYEFALDKQRRLAEYKRSVATTSDLELPDGRLLNDVMPPRLPAGEQLKPSVLEFIEFLRHCGGFKIS